MNIRVIISISLISLVGAVLSFNLLAILPAIAHALYLPVALHIAYSDLRTYHIHMASLIMAFMLAIMYALFINANLSTGIIFEITRHYINLAIALSRGAIIYLGFWLLNCIYRRLRGTTGIAGGDIWLFAIAAIWLPWDLYPLFILTASLGALAAIFLRNARRGRRMLSGDYVPFGAFLAISLWLTVLSEFFPG